MSECDLFAILGASEGGRDLVAATEGNALLNDRLTKGLMRALVAAPVAVAVAGCTTAGSEPPTTVSTSGAATTVTMGTPTPITTVTSPPSSTSSSQSVGPSIPNEKTIGGAQQFVSYYIAQLNDSLKNADPQQISGLSSESCQTCSTWSQRVQSLRDQSQHLSADLYTPNSVATTKLTDNAAEVLVFGEQRGANVLNAAGIKTDTVPKLAKANFLFTLNYDGGWKVGLWQTA